MDSRFEGKYKVIKNILGELTTDTVRFTLYDHFGNPAMAQYKYVLLFLREYCGKLYHEKYQFFDIYPTEDGRWARPGDPYAYDQDLKDKPIKPVPIKFKDNLIFKRYDYFPFEINKKFPFPYFKFDKDDIIPFTGAYLEDLLEIKKIGVLKSRGFVFE